MSIRRCFSLSCSGVGRGMRGAVLPLMRHCIMNPFAHTLAFVTFQLPLGRVLIILTGSSENLLRGFPQ